MFIEFWNYLVLQLTNTGYSLHEIVSDLVQVFFIFFVDFLFIIYITFSFAHKYKVWNRILKSAFISVLTVISFFFYTSWYFCFSGQKEEAVPLLILMFILVGIMIKKCLKKHYKDCSGAK